MGALALTTPLLLGAALSSTPASAATAGSATLVATPPDHAAQTPGVMRLGLLLTSRKGALQPDAAGVITCTLNVQYPHASGHVAGTVNVISTNSCDAPVSALATTLALYYWDGSAWELENSASNENFGQASLTTQTAAACVSGIWVGVAAGEASIPGGFASTTSASPEVSISC